MERVLRALRRERIADANDCQRDMRLLKVDMAATIKATRELITESQSVLTIADKLLARRP